MFIKKILKKFKFKFLIPGINCKVSSFNLRYVWSLVPTKPLVVPETLRKLIQILIGCTVCTLFFFLVVHVRFSRVVWSKLKSNHSVYNTNNMAQCKLTQHLPCHRHHLFRLTEKVRKHQLFTSC
jgi:hypothetical protein